jgi:hypothetical protein
MTGALLSHLSEGNLSFFRKASRPAEVIFSSDGFGEYLKKIEEIRARLKLSDI